MNHRLWKCVFGFVTEVDTDQGGQTCLRRPEGPLSDFADLRVSTICNRFWETPIFDMKPNQKAILRKTVKMSSGSLQCPWNQRKTKGQQLKGKIVSALFHTFWHFSELFLQDLELVQRDEKRTKGNTKKTTKSFCTLVVTIRRRPPRPLGPWKTPPSLDFQLKNRTTPLPAPRTPPSPSARRKK